MRYSKKAQTYAKEDIKNALQQESNAIYIRVNHSSRSGLRHYCDVWIGRTLVTDSFAILSETSLTAQGALITGNSDLTVQAACYIARALDLDYRTLKIDL